MYIFEDPHFGDNKMFTIELEISGHKYIKVYF